jgi:putative aminopeptidase FrvX
MGLPAVDTQYLLHFLTGLLNTPSPTGYADQAVLYVGLAMQEFPVHLSRTHKGALLATWPGRRNDASRGLTAHVDTLGAMVKEIKPNGRLKLTKIGGFAWNTVEGEGCTVYTRKSQTLRGSLLLTKASAHIHGKDVQDTPRDDEHMEVRLDERTSTPEETRALGI